MGADSRVLGLSECLGSWSHAALRMVFASLSVNPFSRFCTFVRTRTFTSRAGFVFSRSLSTAHRSTARRAAMFVSRTVFGGMVASRASFNATGARPCRRGQRCAHKLPDRSQTMRSRRHREAPRLGPTPIGCGAARGRACPRRDRAGAGIRALGELQASFVQTTVEASEHGMGAAFSIATVSA